MRSTMRMRVRVRCGWVRVRRCEGADAGAGASLTARLRGRPFRCSRSAGGCATARLCSPMRAAMRGCAPGVGLTWVAAIPHGVPERLSRRPASVRHLRHPHDVATHQAPAHGVSQHPHRPTTPSGVPYDRCMTPSHPLTASHSLSNGLRRPVRYSHPSGRSQTLTDAHGAAGAQIAIVCARRTPLGPGVPPKNGQIGPIRSASWNEHMFGGRNFFKPQPPPRRRRVGHIRIF